MFIFGKEQHREKGEVNMNVFYLKLGNSKVYVESDIISEESKVTITFSEETGVSTIKELLSNLSDLTIYSAIVQEDGRETDEIVYMYFANITKLDKIVYNASNEKYSTIIVEPNELEERIAEAEDAINFLLMEGEE